MLGKTAGGLYWLSRYLERSENYARLLEAGLRIAMTRSSAASDEWASVLTTAGGRRAYRAKYDEFRQSQIIDWMLRDRENPSSVLSVVKMARDNARLVRTALTREVWEAVNESWMTLKDELAQPVADRDLPDMLDLVRSPERSGARRDARHAAAQRRVPVRPARHIHRARRQHRADHRRQIFRAAAVHHRRRLQPGQRAVGNDPALMSPRTAPIAGP